VEKIEKNYDPRWRNCAR